MYTILERKNLPRIAEELPKVIFNVLADNDTDKSAFIADYPNAAPGTSIVVLSDEGVETKYIKQNDSDYVELVSSGGGGGGSSDISDEFFLLNITYDVEHESYNFEKTFAEIYDAGVQCKLCIFKFYTLEDGETYLEFRHLVSLTPEDINGTPNSVFTTITSSRIDGSDVIFNEDTFSILPDLTCISSYKEVRVSGVDTQA